MSYVFLFGEKGLAVISQGFWVTSAFDSSLGILLQSKSSFESYLVKPKWSDNDNEFLEDMKWFVKIICLICDLIDVVSMHVLLRKQYIHSFSRDFRSLRTTLMSYKSQINTHYQLNFTL